MAKSEKKEIIIKNYMEDIVKKHMKELLEKRTDVCRCELCENDIFAYSLNHLPPKYVVTDRGRIYTKLQEMEVQFNADVTREVLKAIEFVKKNKRHK